MKWTDKLTRAATVLVVTALAVVAGAISFSHMSTLALAHGQSGWKSTAFPISVDGLELMSSLYILAQRRAGRGSGWLPWAALVVGTVASLAANVAVGGDDPVGRALAGWPAISLLVSIKMLFSLFDHDEEDRPLVPSRPSVPGTVPETVRDDQRTVLDGPAVRGTVPGTVHDGSVSSGTAGLGVAPGRAPRGPETPAGTCQGSVRLDARDVVALLPLARQAHAALAASGHTLSRDRLATRLREDGYGLSNARAGQLVKLLKAETEMAPAHGLRVGPMEAEPEQPSSS